MPRDAFPQDKMWQELVDVAQATAGASAVYLGILEQGEEAGRILDHVVDYVGGSLAQGGDPAGPYISYLV